ncbi:MAG: M48 family metallopeptidase [Planctomycetota bacterium]
MKQFNDHQDIAFAQSAKLVLLLAVAIIGTVLLSSLAATYVVAVYLYSQGLEPHQCWPVLEGAYGFFCVIFGSIVSIGTIYKLMQLKEGGAVIALGLGGRLAEPESSKEERQLTNIVEEMAIASGVHCPDVYILSNDEGINAFAAGYHKNEAVIGVTQGAIQKLTRDQLQGVVAHEYSHILNGDMAINLRMVGWLHGILCITLFAKWMIRKGQQILCCRHRRGAIGLAFGIILLGMAVWLVGFIGAAFALLIKSATNRQREYLADAFAVQFTRHPLALANAFKRLGGHASGSRVRSAAAFEASHFFLSDACGSQWTGLLASHPPLAQRIARLDPSWDGMPVYEEVDMESREIDQALGMQVAPVGADASEFDEQVSDLEHDSYRQEILGELPEEITQIVALPQGAELIVAAVWLNELGDTTSDRAGNGSRLNETQVANTAPMQQLLAQFSAAQRLALIDLALDVLPSQPMENSALPLLEELKPNSHYFDWMLRAAVQRIRGEQEMPSALYAKIEKVGKAAEYALSYFCHAGNSDSMAGFAFQRGIATLGLEHAEFLGAEQMDWEQFEASVELLSQLAPVPKRNLLLAMAATIAADNEVAEDEAYLLRSLCLRLGFAPTRLLVGQSVAPCVC